MSHCLFSLHILVFYTPYQKSKPLRNCHKSIRNMRVCRGNLIKPRSHVPWVICFRNETASCNWVEGDFFQTCLLLIEIFELVSSGMYGHVIIVQPRSQGLSSYRLEPQAVRCIVSSLTELHALPLCLIKCNPIFGWRNTDASSIPSIVIWYQEMTSWLIWVTSRFTIWQTSWLAAARTVLS